MSAKITVGIPTYKRPDLLKRALDSFVHNCIRDELKINVLVSVDGFDEKHGDYKKLEKEFEDLKFITFIFHEKNIGSLKNFFFLRDNCNTEYFMWLADDDEISFLTIKEMYNKLSNNNAISIVPYWELNNSSGIKKIIKPKIFDDKYLLKRIVKYLYDSDDAFFYGLHKAKYLKKCKFENFWWPNKGILSNWCYVFQFDLILQGKVILLENKDCKWVNHDYGNKYYPRASNKKIYSYFSFFIRKINMYCSYFFKIIQWKKYNLILFLIPIFLIFLIRDTFSVRPIYKRIKF